MIGAVALVHVMEPPMAGFRMTAIAVASEHRLQLRLQCQHACAAVEEKQRLMLVRKQLVCTQAQFLYAEIAADASPAEASTALFDNLPLPPA